MALLPQVPHDLETLNVAMTKAFSSTRCNEHYDCQSAYCYNFLLVIVPLVFQYCINSRMFKKK